MASFLVFLGESITSWSKKGSKLICTLWSGLIEQDPGPGQWKNSIWINLNSQSCQRKDREKQGRDFIGGGLETCSLHNELSCGELCSV